MKLLMQTFIKLKTIWKRMVLKNRYKNRRKKYNFLTDGSEVQIQK